MIQSCTITNFRGIRQGELAPLAPLTILTGPNNSGKSTCLEAMSVAWSPMPWDALNAVVRRRGWIGRASLEFVIGSGGASIVLQGRVSSDTKALRSTVKILPQDVPSANLAEIARREGLRGHLTTCTIDHTLQIDNSVAPIRHILMLDDEGRHLGIKGGDAGVLDGSRQQAFLDAHVITESLGDALSKADTPGEESHQRLLAYLRKVDAGVQEIRADKVGDSWMPHIFYAKKRVPLSLSGDGIIRLFSIVGNLAPLQDAVIFMEEPECYQHIGSLEQLTRIVWDAIDAGNQIITSTHSLEFLDMLCLEAANHKAGLERTALFRLALADGTLKAVHVPGPDITLLLRELEEDLRK